MVGVPTFARKENIDLGFVFLFIRSNNPKWHPIIIKSVVTQFKKSTLFLGNGNINNSETFSKIPEQYQDLYEYLNSLNGKKHNAAINMDDHYGYRFLAKIALGFGALFLNENFIHSESANLLRNFMWELADQDRGKVPLKGTSFMRHTTNRPSDLLNWPNAHTIALINQGPILSLYCSFYGIQTATVELSNNPEHWKGKIGKGIIFGIAPGIKRYAGPIFLINYLSHKFDEGYKHKDLEMLEEELSKKPTAPPFTI